eukprot:TRINITY_DN66700_c10_g2_i1.p1 TRINITY_DN66700_c10_g2~~TRINITY_DN66700_c10_g2_i1.p1  ORF type:complete len:209 (-),score=7.65 TRINITY_DN66700_c10_g2_i1:24-650(-)
MTANHRQRASNRRSQAAQRHIASDVTACRSSFLFSVAVCGRGRKYHKLVGPNTQGLSLGAYHSCDQLQLVVHPSMSPSWYLVNSASMLSCIFCLSSSERSARFLRPPRPPPPPPRPPRPPRLPVLALLRPPPPPPPLQFPPLANEFRLGRGAPPPPPPPPSEPLCCENEMAKNYHQALCCFLKGLARVYPTSSGKGADKWHSPIAVEG